MRTDFMFRYLQDTSSQVMIFYSAVEDPKDSVAMSSAIPWSTQFSPAQPPPWESPALQRRKWMSEKLYIQNNNKIII